MRKTKKFIASALVATLLGSMLVGCKSTEEGKSSDSGANDTVNLRFLSWLSDYKEQDQKIAEKYKETHPNVNVTFEYYGDMTATEYYKKVDLMAMGGDEMDILMAAAFPEHAQRAGSGTYLALDDYFAAENVKPEEAYELCQKVNDKLYGIPGDMKSWLVMLNKNYLEEAGLPVPSLDWTWDDYREYAMKLTQGEGATKRYGSYFHNWDTFMCMGLWSTYPDNPMFKQDMSAVNFDDPQFKEWMQFRYDLENTDKCSMPYGDITSMGLSYRDKFFNGEVAMLPIGSWLISELGDQEKYPHDFVTTFAPIPTWRGHEAGTTFTESHFYSVSKNSKHPQEAYDFIRFYTTEGMKIKGVSISAEKGIDKMEFINKLITDPKYVDVENLDAVMNNPNWKDLVYNNVPIYNKEMSQLMSDEFAKYLLGTDSLDNVIQSLIKNATQLMKDKGQN